MVEPGKRLSGQSLEADEQWMNEKIDEADPNIARSERKSKLRLCDVPEMCEPDPSVAQSSPETTKKKCEAVLPGCIRDDRKCDCEMKQI